MEENSGQAQGNRRLKWTDEINSTLLECKRKAVLMTKSNAPEAMDGNHKKGYMEIMKELWDQHGYEYLAIPRKNLQNQAARLEKSLGNAANNILDKVGRQQGDETKRNNDENIENMANIDNISTEENANQLENGMNLHSIHSTTPMGFTENQLTVEARALKEKASQMFEFVYSQPGDYGAREIDTRTKEKPTKRDIENINIVVGEIINQHILSPVEDPFILQSMDC